MNILIATADYPPIEGGISTVAREMARELAEQGHQVTVLAPYFSGMDDFDKTEPVTVQRFHGYALGWLRIFPMIQAIRARMRWADVVFAINVSHGGLIAWLLKGFYKKPYVTFGYAYEFLRFKSVPLVPQLLKDIYNDAALVVAISSFTHESLRDFGVEDERLVTLHPGAPEALYVGDEFLERVRERYFLNDGPVILAVGRFVVRKGHVRLVKALPAILEEFPNAVLVMVGQGPEIVSTTRVAQTFGVRDSVRLPGRLSDREVAALYQLCDVFALPTGQDKGGHVEGFGLVFAEAQVYGKPVVAGRSGGTVDAVLDGETGIVIDPEDVEALSESIKNLLRDPQRAAALGQAGKERVERELNWKVFTSRVVEEYEKRS